MLVSETSSGRVGMSSVSVGERVSIEVMASPRVMLKRCLLRVKKTEVHTNKLIRNTNVQFRRIFLNLVNFLQNDSCQFHIL